MKNILILGANGGLAQTVIPVLLENSKLYTHAGITQHPSACKPSPMSG